MPFPFERKPQVPSWFQNYYRKAEVPLDRVIATQTYVTAKGVKLHKKTKPVHDIDLPLVYRTSDDRYFVADGHHRLVAALKSGHKQAMARVIDIGDPDNPMLQVAPEDLSPSDRGRRGALGLAGKTKPLDVELATADEQGVHFETGKPVTFTFVRNTEKSPYVGERFGQDIEPHGRYLIHNEDPGDLARGWQTGSITFESPLVIPLTGDENAIYGPEGWKARLVAATGKKGRALSRYLAKRYDGIVTVDRDGYTREIVDLSSFRR